MATYVDLFDPIQPFAAIHWQLLHCIVSPQLWTDMSCFQDGPLTLVWWWHSIYVAWNSTIYGIFILICCILPLSVHFVSVHFVSVHFVSVHFVSVHFVSVQFASTQADHPQTKHTLAHHPQILQPWPNLWHSSMWKKWQKGQTIRILKETRCHSGKTVFKELDSVRFNVSSLLVLYAWI